MADWREPGRIDYIWRGALLTSCLVHLCLVSAGWLIYSHNAQLIIPLNRAIKVALINSQPRKAPVAKLEPPAVEKKNPPPVVPIRKIVQPPPVKKQPVTPIAEVDPPVKKVRPVVKKKIPPKPAPVKKPVVAKKVITPPPEKVEPVVQSEPVPVAAVELVTQMQTPARPTPVEQDVPVNDGPVGAAVTAAEGPTAADTQLQSERDSYLALLRGRIERHKKYPLMARKGRQQGSVLVQFELTAEGALRDCFVKESCGFRLLDRAAIRAVKAAAPFPSLPASLVVADNVFIVPVRFLLSSR